jgi:hypothetical protein
MRSIITLLFIFPLALAAQLPSSDVWLFTYEVKQNNYFFTGGQNVSNHDGYDNQPSFSPTGEYMLWTAQRDSNETDIFRYDIANRTTMRFTQTAYSEYSPTYMPGKKFISSVVVEKDSVQRLWKYHRESADAKPLLPSITGVGYHCWFDERKVFLFLITEPSTLMLADVKSGKNKVCAGNVGRCMQVYNSGKQRLLLFTQQEEKGALRIRALQPNGVVAESFASVALPEGSQDFVVDYNGNILAAKGTKLFRWKIGAGTAWEEIADFAGHGLHNITRLSLSPDGKHIALVDNAG